MGRNPCCPKEGLNKGAWSETEDKLLTDYIKIHGEGKWRNIPKKTGLRRSEKSCRLRWRNYLRPGIKRGNITNDEEDLIIRLHKLLGNRWSLIAGRLPGRTDNEIKNYWNTIIRKKLQNKKNQLNQSQQAKSNPLPLVDDVPNTTKVPQEKTNTNPIVTASMSPTKTIFSDNKELQLEFGFIENNVNDSSDFLLDIEIDQQLLSCLLDVDSYKSNVSETTTQSDDHCNYQLTTNSSEISLQVSDDSTKGLGFSSLINENCDFDWL